MDESRRPADRMVLCIGREPCDRAVVEALAAGGWTVRTESLQAAPAALVTDCLVGIVCIPGADPAWLDLLTARATAWRYLELVAVLAPGAIDDARVRKFVAACCIDYQTLPISTDRLLFALGHAQGMAAISRQTRAMPGPTLGGIDLVGDSPAIRKVRRDVERIARSDAPVFVTGESGTGKELAARGIHARSTRHDEPFVAVNCASLSPTLIHAELFGYEKGAFTGAARRKIGHLETAHRGTVFLDEIGDLDLGLQVLLLRFLEDGSFRRVGGREEVTVDVRVIAATHVDIESAVRAGRFREDLYYRLNVLRVHMPALRERREDIRVLAQLFLGRFGSERADDVRGFTDDALVAMRGHAWPGNVRELMNRIRRGVVMAEGQFVSAADLQLTESPAGETRHPHLSDARQVAERQTLIAALGESGGHAAKAAELLGVSRATLYRLLARHALNYRVE